LDQSFYAPTGFAANTWRAISPEAFTFSWDPPTRVVGNLQRSTVAVVRRWTAFGGGTDFYNIFADSASMSGVAEPNYTLPAWTSFHAQAAVAEVVSAGYLGPAGTSLCDLRQVGGHQRTAWILQTTNLRFRLFASQTANSYPNWPVGR